MTAGTPTAMPPSDDAPTDHAPADHAAPDDRPAGHYDTIIIGAAPRACTRSTCCVGAV